MVVVMNLTSGPEQITAVQQRLEQYGFEIHFIRGVKRLVIGAVGDRREIASLGLEAMPGVESIVPIMKPYKGCSWRSTPSHVKRCVTGPGP